MSYDKTMRMIRRANYRMKVTQDGGVFIQVKDFDEELRKAELDKIMYDRENGYSGFDEFNDQPEREWDHE